MEIDNLNKIMYFMYFLYCIFSSKSIFFLSTGEIKISVIINYYLVDFRFIF